MGYLRIIFLIFFLVLPGVAISNSGPEGFWLAYDKDTQKAKAVIQVYQTQGKLFAKIVELLLPTDKGSVCSKCKGELKNKPIEGIQILQDLTPKKDNTWSGGTALDPANGKIYRAKVVLQDAGKLLEVRGYIGFSLIGRSEFWKRKN